MIRGVLIVTPEYPPKILGQTSLRAQELARRLRDEGLLVTALVHDDVLVGNFIEDSIRVVRISNPIRTYYSVLTVEMFLTTQFIREGKKLIEGEMVDLIVSFEWLTLASACALKMGFGLPLVSIVQSTEPQRSAWRRDPLSITIENFEKSLLVKADLVVPYSTQTMNVLSDYYRVDQKKIAAFDLHSEYAMKALLSLLDRGGDEDESPDVNVGIPS
jgi:hypothetical protein